MTFGQKERLSIAAGMTTTRERLDTWTLSKGVGDGRMSGHAAEQLSAGVPIAVPGSVLGVLVERGIVADVTVDGTEQELEWVSSCSWIYRTEVPRQGKGAGTRLIFEGVDTLATIRVDGEAVLATDDMFHSWVVDLGADEGSGSWTVEVEFQPALPVATAAESSAPFPRADMYEIPYNQVRKMACSFGWDWGPVTNTAGLWREVVLERTPRGRIDRALLEGTWDGGAVLRGTVNCEGELADIAVEVRDAVGDLVESGSFTVVGGTCGIELRVPQASQWNVAGRGEQPLYSVVLIATTEDGLAVDTVTRRLGFRLLELIQTRDDIGESFAFHVNGARVWARGFNWIPADVLPERVTRYQIRGLISDVAATGANMLRVWGGGVIESDDFFDACDELGILVWQDFSFACAAYPEDDIQATRVTLEVEDAVERVGYRPSLALWCGCNENLWGHEDWGWKDTLGEDGPWGARLYFEVIPDALSRLDPHRPYVPGSPFSADRSAHPNDQTMGTTHHWDTWNLIDYSEFENKRSRFASEFGWQAPSSWPTLVAAIGGVPSGAKDERLPRLQKAFEGAQSLARGIQEHFGTDDDAGAEWYLKAQIVQARAIRAGVGRFRSLHDTCSGALWWQFNDCWPGFSWSVEDVNGRRKLSYFAAREVMAARAVIPTADGSPHALTLVNDLAEPWVGDVTVTVINAQGSILLRTETATTVPADGFLVVGPEALPEGACAVVVDAGDLRAARWIVPDRDIPSFTAEARLKAIRDDSGAWRVTVSVSSLVRDLVLLTELHPLLAEARVSTQLLVLLPGEEATFVVTGAAKGAISGDDWGRLLKAGNPLSVVAGEA